MIHEDVYVRIRTRSLPRMKPCLHMEYAQIHLYSFTTENTRPAVPSFATTRTV